MPRIEPLVACIGLAVAACSPPRDSAPADSDPVRDDEPALDVTPALFVDEEVPMRPLADGDPLDLSRAVQGGHVTYVGARVEGLTTVSAFIEARLRDPDTRTVHAHEARTITMVETGEPGVKEPDLRSRSQVAHIPACPNYGTRAVVGERWILEVLVRGERSDGSRVGFGSAEIVVTPTCAQSESAARSLCECECAESYVLGACP